MPLIFQKCVPPSMKGVGYRYDCIYADGRLQVALRVASTPQPASSVWNKIIIIPE